MFKVFVDGVYHSTYGTFAEACRQAHNQAALHHNSYFTVFAAGETGGQPVGDSGTLKGVPDYIITPRGKMACRAGELGRALPPQGGQPHYKFGTNGHSLT